MQPEDMLARLRALSGSTQLNGPLSVDQLIKHYSDAVYGYVHGRDHTDSDTYIIGIQGPIGIGKTTLAAAMQQLLTGLGFTAQHISIDDYYLPYEARVRIARKHPHNPYYQVSRGMPGTHDVDALHETVTRAKQGDAFTIPSFDKSLHGGKGDVLPEETHVEGACDFILLEGWFVGWRDRTHYVSTVCRDARTAAMLHDLDPGGTHAKQVFDNLAPYVQVWDLLDVMTVLRPQDIMLVSEWRRQQEQQLITATGHGQSNDELLEFVKPFILMGYYIDSLHEAEPSASTHQYVLGKDHLPIQTLS
jgi:D-glycerate 3-kinase